MVQARGRTFLVVAALALSSHIWPVGSERGSEETEAAKSPAPTASARDAGRWRGKERGAVRSVFPRSADGRKNSGLLELDHGYYKSQYSPSYPIPSGSWEIVGGGDRRNVVTSGTLDSGKRTKAVRLSFAFPFYGHPVRNLSIATEGFLSTGSLLLSSLASTQYIAPLMANFGAGKDPPSVVRYRDNGTSFTVEWSKVKLQDSGEGGRFSFMVTLFKDGRIAYFYKEIPTPVERIDDSSYPVRVGISDAYTVDVLLYPSANGHRKTIYEYNTIDLDLSKVKNGSSFFLSPLPTCTQFSDCQSCVSSRIGFECRWCRSLRRCSDGGKDRNKQQWVDARCDEQSASMVCEAPKVVTTTAPTPPELLQDGSVITQDNLTDTMTRPDSGQLPPQETTPKSSSRQKTVHNFLDDGPFPVEVEVNGNAKENKNKRKRTSVKTRSRYLETEVIIGILIAVVVLVIAIAWIIHAYSRRSSPELVVVEWRGPDVVKPDA
ncbi:plexin domain-containing protein 2-like [Branchiostoma floridae x Branchiostoma japonicum]